MAEPKANVTDFPGPSTGSGDNTGGMALLGERIASLEAHLQHMATREDIEKNAKNTMKWVVGIMITSLIAAIAATAAVMGALIN